MSFFLLKLCDKTTEMAELLFIEALRNTGLLEEKRVKKEGGSI